MKVEVNKKGNAMMKKKFKQILACGLSVSLALSSMSNVAFAGDTNPSATKQIRSIEEFVPYANLELKNGKNLIMDDWKFSLGDKGNAEQMVFDDSEWKFVNLPHDYSIRQNYTDRGEAESGYLLGGIGWYRKNFTLSNSLAGKRIFIDFDGVYMNAEVYVNGNKVGEHPYGYTAFSFDLTDHLRFGEENVLAVKVNNNIPTSRWYSGSGIYRNVYLTVTDQVHIQKDGVVITTPDIKDNQKTPKVVIDTQLKNHGTENTIVKVEQKIYKKNTDQVLTNKVEENIELQAGANKTVRTELQVANPDLWSVAHPNLYTVETVVSKGSDIIETHKSDFGFRWTEFDADTGFSLNGKKMKLQGVCMHHDQGALGSAAYAAAIERQIDILKEMGVNAVRASHNPTSEDFVRLANEKGMLLIQEAFDTWTINKNQNSNDYGKYFNKVIGADNHILGKRNGMTWGEWDTKAMVKRDRNAPSVIMWSTGNEVLEGNDWGQPTHEYPNIIANIAKWMKEEDATRPSTIGDNKIKGNDPTAVNMMNALHRLDGIIGFNYADSRQLASAHRRNPNWKIYASETSSAVNSRGVYTTRTKQGYNLTSYDESTVPWGQLSSADWYNIITKDYVAGNFVWTGFDYLGEPTPSNDTVVRPKNFPMPKSSYFGIVDLAGFPKDRYYFYSSQWRKDITTLHLLPAWHEGIVNGQDNIVVYSNAPTVKLFFTPEGSSDKQLVETQTMTKVTTDAGYSYMTTNKSSSHKDLYYRFTKPYQAGKLEVEAYNEAGEKIENTFGRNMVQTTKAPHALKIKANRKDLKANGRDLSYITIDVVDEKGNIVPNADNKIKVQVTGAGSLAAMDNGKQDDMTSYYEGSKNAFSGKALAIVKTAKKDGVINVAVSADGLEGATLTLNATGAEESTSEIKGYRYSRNYMVKVGGKLNLDTKVKVVMKNNDEVEKTVVWNMDNIDSKLQTAGNFKVTGTIEGIGSISANVQVLNEIAAILNYSTYVRKGYTPSLPSVRPAVDKAGENLSAFFKVNWNQEQLNANRFAETGIVTVEGKAQVFGEDMPVIATIRVVEAQVEYGKSLTSSA